MTVNKDDRSTVTPSETAAGEQASAFDDEQVNVRQPPTALVAAVPTLLTFSNLIAGFAAIHYATSTEPVGPWGWSGLTFAAALVFLGLVVDAIDGAVARMMNAFSDVGAELDSFADAVTFGVAPAYMTLQLFSQTIADNPDVMLLGAKADQNIGRLVWAFAAIYVCCAALRLARYNVIAHSKTDEATTKFFGLPSPGGAGILSGLIILHQHILFQNGGEISDLLLYAAGVGVPIIMLLCAFGMVSTIPYVHFTNTFLRGPKTTAYMLRLVIILVAFVTFFQETIAVACVAYVLSGPLMTIVNRIRRKPR